MRGRGKQWIGFLIMVIGTGLLLGPFVLGDLGTREQERTVAELREMLRPSEAATEPATLPATEPTTIPTELPTLPATEPTTVPTELPTTEPTTVPTEPEAFPTTEPTTVPTEPEALPTTEPTTVPTEPEALPAAEPATIPTEPATIPEESAPIPASEPTEAPTEPEPVTEPTAVPVPQETEPAPAEPAAVPTEPVTEPTTVPTEPEAAPTEPVTEPEQELPYPVAGSVTTIQILPTPDPAPDAPAKRLDPMERFYQDAKAYNENLLGKGQDDMNSLYSLEYFQLDATKYGFRENVVGTISIPRLDVEVPLYLGANSEHMGKGFAIFGRSSLPLGEGVENVAIAGHRGWRGTAMLRDVQQILIGDPIFITTPWRDLTYYVTGIEVVTPNNVSWCRIHPGKTMISLMTCHPYGEHTHRYIVYAELMQEPQPRVMHSQTLLDRFRPDPDAPISTIKPAAAPTEASQPTEPAAVPTIPTTEPTIPNIEPTVPTLPATEPTIPATEPTIPSAPAEEPTSPTVPTAEPTIPSAPAAETTTPTAPAAEPTVPSIPAVEPTAPTVPAAEPTVPTTEPTAPVTEPTTVPTEAPSEPVTLPVRERPTLPATEPTIPVVQEIVFVHDDGTREVILMDTSEVAPDDREFTTQWSDTMIFAEDSMRPVAYVVACLVPLVGLWLLIATIRDAKNDKRGKKHDKE